MEKFRTVEKYLAHKMPMLLVRELAEVADESVTCLTTVDAGFEPFLNAAGELPAHFLLEIAAQTIGVWAGYHQDDPDASPKPGMLLSCRKFIMTKPAFAKGTKFRSEARKLVQDEHTASFECVLSVDGNAVSWLILTTYQTEWENFEDLIYGE